MHKPRSAKPLRSQRWHAGSNPRASVERARLAQLGYHRDEFIGKPVIAIINPWSDLNAAGALMRERAQDVRRGILEAGGFPVELPTMSLAESAIKSTTMLYRNFLAIESEELLRFHPVDGAVLLGGCGKTTAGLLMGGISAELPMIFLPPGPMLPGYASSIVPGDGKIWRHSEPLMTEISEAAEESFARTPGTSMGMESASTMPLIAEALGLTLPGASSIPAHDAAHRRMAASCGRAIVDIVRDDMKPRDVLTRHSFENAFIAMAAAGGSINAIINLMALARRAGIRLGLSEIDHFARYIPVIADLQPGGRWRMEDFHKAGGSRAFFNRLAPRLHNGERSILGGSLALRYADAKVLDDEVIRPLDRPVTPWSGIAVLTGNIAPEGCVIRTHRAEARLMKHIGPALVFDDEAVMLKAMADPALDVTPDHVMILRYSGPFGGTGMPELSDFPIPAKLAKAGVKDMLRITDGRMSGRGSGACILHVSPEAYMGGPLAVVRNGDRIAVDVEKRRISLMVDDDELGRRLDEWSPPQRRKRRGSLRLFASHIRQAHEGCDFDFFEADDAEPGKDGY